MMVGITSLFLSVILGYVQTIHGKRLCWYTKQYRNRTWLLLFNTSRRIVIAKDFYKQLKIDEPSIIGYSVLRSRFVEDPKLIPSDGSVIIGFEYIEPKGFILIEIKTKTKKDIEMSGFLLNGDIVHRRYSLGALSHCFIVEYLMFVIPMSFMSAGLLLLGEVDGTISGNGTIWVVMTSTGILGMFVFIFFDTYRRIPDTVFHRASRAVRNRIKDLRERRIDVVWNCFEKKGNQVILELKNTGAKLFRCLKNCLRRMMRVICKTAKQLCKIAALSRKKKNNQSR